MEGSTAFHRLGGGDWDACATLAGKFVSLGEKKQGNKKEKGIAEFANASRDNAVETYFTVIQRSQGRRCRHCRLQ